jgi:hypothetical protein
MLMVLRQERDRSLVPEEAAAQTKAALAAMQQKLMDLGVDPMS